MRIAAAVLVCGIGLSLAGCKAGSSPAGSDDGGYTPVLAAKPTQAASRGTVKGDFDWAASSANLREASLRWDQFLQRHIPAGGEYEDAFQKRHIDAARYELMRVSYLLGERAKGDRLLKELDPLQLQ